ncbi:hypothetical protein [Planotetraspora phitsanulokensis]|nr:hypothetical protein [Planotetraspora phitsanulokensis]
MAWTRREADAQNSAAAATPPPSFGRSPAGEEAAWTPEEEPAYNWFSPPPAEVPDTETSDRFEDTNQFRAIKPSDSFPPFQSSGAAPASHHDRPHGVEGPGTTPAPESALEPTPTLEQAPGTTPAPDTALAPGIAPHAPGPGRHTLSRPASLGAFASQPEEPNQQPERPWSGGTWPESTWSGGSAVQADPVWETGVAGQSSPAQDAHSAQDPFTGQDAIAAQSPAAAQDPLTTHDPFTAQDPVAAQDLFTAQDPVPAHDPFTAHNPVTTREPFSAQNSDTAQDLFRAGEPGDAGAHAAHPADPHALLEEPGGHGDWPPPWTPPPNLEDRSRPWSPDPGVDPSDDASFRDGSRPARHAAWPAPAPETYGASQPNPAPEAAPAQPHDASETYGSALPYDPVDPGDPLGYRRHADSAGPAHDAPVPEVPVSGAPVFGAPVYETSRHDLPGHDAHVLDSPVLDIPVVGAAGHDVAAHERYGQDDLLSSAPVLGAPVYDTPVLPTPGHGTSGDALDGDGGIPGGDRTGGERVDGAEAASTRPAEPGDVPVWPPRLTGEEVPPADGRPLHHEAPPVEHEAAAIEVADARTEWPLGSSAARTDATEQPPLPVDPADTRTGVYEPFSSTGLPADLAPGNASGIASDEALAGPSAVRDEAPSGWGSGDGDGPPTGTVRSLWPRLENDPSGSGQGADEAIALAITPTSGFPPPETGHHVLPIEEPSGSQPPQTPSPHMTPGHMPPAPTPQNPATAPTTPFAFTPVTPPKAAMKSLPAGFDSLGSAHEMDADGPPTTPQPKVPVLPGPPPDLPPVSQDDRGRPASGMAKRVLLAAGGAVVIACIGAAAFYAYTGQSTTGATTAAPAAAPSAAGTPDVAEAPSPKPVAATILDSQKTDPRKMSLTEAFPVSRVTVAGRAFRRVKVGSTDTCAQAASGTFAVALQKQKCSRVLRATYVDSKKQFAVTTGIAVLPTKQAALSVDQSKNLGGNQWFRGLDGTAETATDRVTISGGYAAGMVWGRYIVFSYATYADGHTPDLKDKSLGPVSGAFRDHTSEVLEKRLTS